MRAVLIAFLALFSISEAIAEEGQIKGTLSTPMGTRVEGYPVIISGTGPSGEQTDWISSTDSEGEFFLQQLPPGKYTAAPANEPEAATSFELNAPGESMPEDKPLEIEIQVTPGEKF